MFGIQWYLSTTSITTSVSPQPDVCNTNCSVDKVISSSVLTYTENIADDGTGFLSVGTKKKCYHLNLFCVVMVLYLLHKLCISI
jgi:hypothetical protein